MAVGHAEHRGCRLRPETGGGDLVEWTRAGWATIDLVAGLRGRATPTAPAALPAAGRVWLTQFPDVHPHERVALAAVLVAHPPPHPPGDPTRRPGDTRIAGTHTLGGAR